MDFSKMTVPQLKELQQQIAAEIQNRELQEKDQLREELKAFVAAKGYTLEELLGKAKARAGKAGARKPVAIKYRHPQDPSLTWAGRGRKPAWVAEWLAKGKSLEKLAV